MKYSIVALFAFSLLVSHSALSETNAPPDAKQHKALFRQKIYERTGGFITRAGSQKGTLLILDCQKTVAASNHFNFVNLIDKRLNYKVAYVQTNAVAQANWASELHRRGAQVLIALVEDDSTPSLVVVPDEHWAAINIRKLDQGIKTESGKKKLIPIRARRQLIRACGLLAGSLSNFKGSPASIHRLEDIDEASDFLPMDQFENFGKYLYDSGMRPRQFATYKKACEEGWAPAPTNDIRKAIWEKVHEIPTKPIKIEFDPKTDTK